MAGPVHEGEIVIATRTYTVVQVCEICGVQNERLAELVSFGIVAPVGSRPEAWSFDETAVHRIKKALRLRRDLGLDQQGLALSLELLDEIDRLRARLARFGDG